MSTWVTTIWTTNIKMTNNTPPAEPVGIGLRHPYYKDVLETDLDLGWLEVHPENYFGGGINRHFLSLAAEKYPISMHGIGLSLGSDQPVSKDHLGNLKELVDLYNPFQISDHASWSASGNAHLNDLLPLPYTKETLARLSDNVARTQNFLGRKILVENPSTYVGFNNDEMSEFEFLNTLAEKTGCCLLLDINNIFVQSFNHGLDAVEYIDGINPAFVGEMHLAGHSEHQAGEHTILIDTHNNFVRADVWKLYEHAVKRFGVIPTLIEWDQNFPTLDILVSEADKARAILQKIHGKEASYAAG